jgi:hypothetical protein
VRKKLDSNAKIREFQQSYPIPGKAIRSARLMVNDKCVAVIWDNVPFRGPWCFSPMHDYIGQIILDGTRVYFSTWDGAMKWLKGYEREMANGVAYTTLDKLLNK